MGVITCFRRRAIAQVFCLTLLTESAFCFTSHLPGRIHAPFRTATTSSIHNPVSKSNTLNNLTPRSIPQLFPQKEEDSSNSRLFSGADYTYGKKGTLEGRLDVASTNFQKGALYVHNNFWDLFFSIYGRVLIGSLALCGATGVAYAMKPELGINIVQGMTEVLITLETLISDSFALVKAAPVYLFVLPFMFLAAVPSKVITALPASGFKAFLMKTIGVPVVHVALWIVKLLAKIAASAEATFVTTGGSTFLEDIASTNPVVFCTQLLVVAPIVEELVFRRFLMTLLKKVMKPKSKGYLDSLQEKRNDLSPWAVISSGIFASAHIVNWIRPLEGKILINTNSLAVAMSLVSLAIASFFATMGVSIRVLTPAYEENGLAASIGAHFMWNLCVLTSIVGLPIRGVNRFIGWVRDKGKSDSSWRWIR